MLKLAKVNANEANDDVDADNDDDEVDNVADCVRRTVAYNEMLLQINIQIEISRTD